MIGRRGTQSAKPSQTVLIEHRDALVRREAGRALRAQGYRVTECSGPDDAHACPALTGEGCGLLDSADYILNGIAGETGRDLVRTQRRELPLIGVRRLYPGRAAIGDTGAPLQHRSELLEALEDALDR